MRTKPKNNTRPVGKTEAANHVGSGDLLGSIEFAVITSKNRRTMTLDFLNGHPVKLNRRQAAGLWQLIGSSLREKSPEPNECHAVSFRLADAKAMCGTPASLPRLKVWSATKPQNEIARTQPRKSRQECNVRVCRVGSYKCKVSMLPNEKS